MNILIHNKILKGLFYFLLIASTIALLVFVQFMAVIEGSTFFGQEPSDAQLQMSAIHTITVMLGFFAFISSFFVLRNRRKLIIAHALFLVIVLIGTLYAEALRMSFSRNAFQLLYDWSRLGAVMPMYLNISIVAILMIFHVQMRSMINTIKE